MEKQTNIPQAYKESSTYQVSPTEDKNVKNVSFREKQSEIPSVHSASQHVTKEDIANMSKEEIEYTAKDTIRQKSNPTHQDIKMTPEEQKVKRENVKDVQEISSNSSSSVDEVSRLKDELLRLHADMDNTKKRLARLYEDKVRDKTVAILLDVIEHIDNFERAFDSQLQMSKKGNEKKNSDADMNAIFAGFGIIKEQLISTLQNNWGLNIIESLDKEFNPNEHEAIMQENSEQITHPTVVQEFMKGYTYLGKVIRHAKVKVALPQKNT